MANLVSATAASAMGAAVLFLALAGLAHLVGATKVAASLARATAIALIVALGLPPVFAAFAGLLEGGGMHHSKGGGPLFCVAIVLGHGALAIFLVARRIDRVAGTTRIDEARRGRARERATSSVRSDEVEP